MYRYTLGFIQRKDEVLLVNRHKNPWKGCWNGLGGKVEIGEDIKSSIIREILEETGIDVQPSQLEDKGILTWNSFDAMGKGLHLFVIKVDDDFMYPTPKQTVEGLLDWKTIEWTTDTENYGVAHNIPYFLKTALFDSKRYHYHCTFEGRHLLSVTKTEETSYDS
jgi:8-oxo-dGTP diphosphatase